MKRQTRKLQLNVETIRTLTTEANGRVMGGTPWTYTCTTTQLCIDYPQTDFCNYTWDGCGWTYNFTCDATCYTCLDTGCCETQNTDCCATLYCPTVGC
jgi:hypothetical protein